MNGLSSCDWRDVQGPVVSGYRTLVHARYLVFSIDSPKSAAAWIAQLLPSVTAADRPRPSALNIAFTYSGLMTLLESSATDLRNFSCPFQEGISGSAHRSLILGDVHSNAPETWDWGGPKRPPVHMLLMLFEGHHRAAADAIARAGASTQGVTLLAELESIRQCREPFGFVDGLSQPILEGTPEAARKPHSRHLVRLGEFLLGHPDNTNEVPPVPSMTGCPDFGVNGTYMVVRQLEQDVDGFWRFMQSHAPHVGLSPKDLAAKIVGRSLEGCVLVPNRADAPCQDDNEFGFTAADPLGEGCPFGAHIRRGNPRDTLHQHQEESWRLVNRHRILRRARSYRENSDNRGLVFIALNADIERQFEFVQQNWINDSGFADLRDERDPLVGRRSGSSDTFTIPAMPIRRRLVPMRQFVTVKGGEYFFLPSLRALAHLAGM